ncbi:hypothetical protein UT300009_30620 [Paraclostridium bifermentans]
MLGRSLYVYYHITSQLSRLNMIYERYVLGIGMYSSLRSEHGLNVRTYPNIKYVLSSDRTL